MRQLYGLAISSVLMVSDQGETSRLSAVMMKLTFSATWNVLDRAAAGAVSSPNPSAGSRELLRRNRKWTE